MNAHASERRVELDVVRILAILAVFVYHCNMIFNSDTWHIKNSVTIPGADDLASLMARWMMPLIFFISGGSIYLSLRNRSAGRFLKDRVLRLAVPLVFGIFTVGPFMVYMERLSHGQFQGSFWAFLPHYFDGMYGFGGNFAWMGLHLWYLLVLFLFTLLLLPVFLFLKSRAGQASTSWLAGIAEKPGVILLFALPFLLSVGLDPETFGRRDMGGKDLLTYLFSLLLGFVLFTDSRYLKAIVRQRWLLLAASLALLVGDGVLFGSSDYADFSAGYYFERGYNQVETWVWAITLLSLGLRYLKFDNKLTRYANEAVLPFYWLHQPVIILVGYFVTRTSLPALAKFWIILPVALVINVGIYELLVRRWNLTRVLLGMKPLRKEAILVGKPQLAAQD